MNRPVSVYAYRMLEIEEKKNTLKCSNVLELKSPDVK